MVQHLRISNDDNVTDVVDKVNGVLEPFGLLFKDDDKEHDGYIIYELQFDVELLKRIRGTK